MGEGDSEKRGERESKKRGRNSEKRGRDSEKREKRVRAVTRERVGEEKQ